jgi:hypothetical protein
MKKNENTAVTVLRPVSTRRSLGLVALASLLAAPLASAQNAGVAEIVDAIEALAPDMGLVIAAAIGIAVIGIGAVAALALGKRLMGR